MRLQAQGHAPGRGKDLERAGEIEHFNIVKQVDTDDAGHGCRSPFAAGDWLHCLDYTQKMLCCQTGCGNVGGRGGNTGKVGLLVQIMAVSYNPVAGSNLSLGITKIDRINRIYKMKNVCHSC
ncbi:MAG: hypothetical protein Kow0031_17760 [Anaerolineae bacterium]